MRIGRVVDWENDVLASWRRSAEGVLAPNQDVWSMLPSGVCWFDGRIERQDLEKMHVIGSNDWKDVFGSYVLKTVAAQVFEIPDDPHRHSSRITGIRHALATGRQFEPLILTAFSGDGPFVVIEGNHRAVALAQLNLLHGQPAFIGFHRAMGTEFHWFRRAVLDED